MTIDELLQKLGVDVTDDAKEAVNDFVAAETAGLKRNRDDLKREKRELEGKVAFFMWAWEVIVEKWQGP